MKIAVTGADGFLGTRLADALLDVQCALGNVTELVLVDVRAPPARADLRVSYLQLELSAPGAAECLITPDLDIVFHLAAIVSGQAEKDLDIGLRVNFDATRALLEAIRRVKPTIKFIFTSTVGVFGGNLPNVVDDLTGVMPQNSYGTAKAMCELLINDYSRKGFVDGRVVRLPTVSVRAGVANAAVTSYASDIVREPLAGRNAVCPVPEDQELWLTSPHTVVHNIIHVATLSALKLVPWRVVNLPGFCISVRGQLRALEEVAGAEAVARVRLIPNDVIARIVATFPSHFDNSRALSLGFVVDSNFEDVIRAYIRDEMKGSVK